MIKAYLYGQEVTVLEFPPNGFVRVRMKKSGNVYEVPMHLVWLQEEK